MNMKRFFIVTAAVYSLFPALAFAAKGKDYMVGAYYYPWYTDEKFQNGRLARSHTLIYHLNPQMTPELGWYSQTHPEVISQHYKWAKHAGIDFFVTSFWGIGTPTDKTTSECMFDNPDRGNIKLAVFFEPKITLANVADQTDYLCDNYFNRPGYFRIDNKPVIFVYLTRVMSDANLAAYTNSIRTAARNKDVGEVYIVGDEVFGSVSSFNAKRVKLLDAITNYDVYGNLGDLGASGQYVTTADLDTWKSTNKLWRTKAHHIGRDFIPAVTPGFNDTAVRNGHPPKSRKLNNNGYAFGTLFAGLLDRAKSIADRNMIMVTSWNEWYEDTQIEPVAIAPPTNVDDSNTTKSFTCGLYYNGYGMLYLDILREKTTQPSVSENNRK
jgi:hypothetical protein